MDKRTFDDFCNQVIEGTRFNQVVWHRRSARSLHAKASVRDEHSGGMKEMNVLLRDCSNKDNTCYDMEVDFCGKKIEDPNDPVYKFARYMFGGDN